MGVEHHTHADDGKRENRGRSALLTQIMQTRGALLDLPLTMSSSGSHLILAERFNSW